MEYPTQFPVWATLAVTLATAHLLPWVLTCQSLPLEVGFTSATSPANRLFLVFRVIASSDFRLSSGAEPYSVSRISELLEAPLSQYIGRAVLGTDLC